MKRLGTKEREKKKLRWNQTGSSRQHFGER